MTTNTDNPTCETCNGPYEIATMHAETMHYFCRPHALEFWEQNDEPKSRTCSYCRKGFTTFDHFARLCPKCEKRKRLCQYCRQPFAPPSPDTDICEGCYFQGKNKEPQFAGLLAEVRALPGVKDAFLAHTGGGCWAFEVFRASDGHYMMATVAYQDEHGWTGDADLPENEHGPWVITSDYDPESGEWLDEGEGEICPADRRDLVDYVKRFISRPVARTEG